MKSHSFKLLERRELPNYHQTAELYEHSCGLQVVSLVNDNVDNMFAVAFSTVPEDSTGVAHIIEHSVLSGSKHYPVKDPFMEMVKRSMATFINALTYQDYTVYPVSSTVPVDFYNLASVYFDAVFCPKLELNTFRSEGWHYESRPGKQAPLTINGIVYNEMLGAMSDVNEIIAKEVYGHLFPGTSRKYVSGGLPEKISSLTYSKYCDFYKSHYHPSVAKVFLSGNIPTVDKLIFLENQLSGLDLYGKPKVLPAYSRQKRWSSPRRRTVRYIPDFDQDPGKGIWVKAYFLGDDYSPVKNIAFNFIDELLLGTQFSPLRKRIAESRLCDNIAISGYDDETLDGNFLICVTGIAPENFAKMEALVDDELARIAIDGFDDEQIQAAFMQYKLEQHEITGEQVYTQMENVFDAWCHGQSPFLYLDNEATLVELEYMLKESPKWLSELIRSELCNNPHRLTLNMLPDYGLSAKRKAIEEKRLAKVKDAMSPGKLESIKKETTLFKAMQEAGNSEEALATLPLLKRQDVPQLPLLLKKSVSHLANGIDFVDVEQYSNGVDYLELAYPFSYFTEEQICVLRLFCSLFSKVGTADCSYDKLAIQWEVLGSSFTSHLTVCNSDKTKSGMESNGYLRICIRGLAKSFPKMLELLSRKLTSSVFTEKQFISFLLRQIWANKHEDFAGNSGFYTNSRCSVGLTSLGAVQDIWDGISSLAESKNMASHFHREYPKVHVLMDGIAGILAKASPKIVTFLGTGKSRQLALAYAQSFSEVSSSFEFVPKQLIGIAGTGRRESMSIAADVSACSRVYAVSKSWDDCYLPLYIYANILSCGYLWNEIRSKGGAYGTYAAYNQFNGTFLLASSQDPSPKNTFDTFDKVPDISLQLSEEDINNAVISTVKVFHTPFSPAGALTNATNHCIMGIDEDFLIRRHDHLLALDKKSIGEAVERLWASKPFFNDCAIGPAKAVGTLHSEKIRLA